VIDQDEATSELRSAFDSFSVMAERVQSAYDSLRETAAHLDQELAEANARLHRQVGELENLSGSLAAVLRAIPCGVVVAGRDGELLMVNPAAERMLNCSSAELVGQAASSVEDARGNPILALTSGPGETLERLVRTDDGARILDGCVVAVSDAAGHELGLVEVLNDRSEVKALKEEVRQLDRLAELGRVAAIIAHEIRNPLSGIRGFAGMLRRQLENEEHLAAPLRWADRICEGADRADAIIDSVLFLARPRPLEKRRVNLAAFLATTYETVVQGSPKLVQGVRVERVVDPPSLAIEADVTRLGQAVSNLIQNSLESLGGEGKLQLLAREIDGRVEIRVTDSGSGIPADLAERLFEPFFSTKSEGAGLGLALVQRIAEHHDGEVRIEPGFGSGASFVLSLPTSDDLVEATV